jgi:hypothetical protein
MNRLCEKAAIMAYLLRVRQSGLVFGELCRWLYSTVDYFGLCRDLAEPYDTPEARIPVAIRPLHYKDISALLRLDQPGITGQGILERLQRLYIYKAHLGSCYVAVAADDSPCYIQWSFDASQNSHIQRHFRGVFPLLAEDEVLFEGNFTLEAYRGLGIMPYTMSQVAASLTVSGVHRVIAFVDRPRTPSLRGFKKAGFKPYVQRTDRWRLFRQKITFTQLPAGTPYAFEAAASAEKEQRGNSTGGWQ